MNNNLTRLVEALQQPLPEDFDWTFSPTYEREGDNACGCAIGLGIHLGILPNYHDRAPSGQLLSHFYAPHLGLSPEVCEAIFYTSPDDEADEIPFTPELVLQRIKELT